MRTINLVLVGLNKNIINHTYIRWDIIHVQRVEDAAQRYTVLQPIQIKEILLLLSLSFRMERTNGSVIVVEHNLYTWTEERISDKFTPDACTIKTIYFLVTAHSRRNPPLERTQHRPRR